MTVAAPPRPPAPATHGSRQQAARTRGDRGPRRGVDRGGAARANVVAIAGTGWSQRSLPSWGAVILVLLDGDAASQTASPAPSARSGAAGGTPSSKIAFVAPTSAGFRRPASWELYVMNPDGSGKRRLARHFWISNFGESPLAWSPDRRKLLFAAHVSRSAAPCASYCGKEIFVINADGSGLRRLTRNAVADSDPAWSPDGQKIVWSLSDGTGADVFVMNADGSDQRNLTLKPGDQGGPRWSPNGRAILFTAVSPMQPPRGSRPYRDVYVMNADGSGQRNLTPTPEAGAFDPAWSPDGHQNRIHPASRSAGGGHHRRHERGWKREACRNAHARPPRRPSARRALVA